MKYIFLFFLLLAASLKIYVSYNPGIVENMPWLKVPFMDILLLLGMFLIAGKRTNGYVVFALISNFMGGFTINNGVTPDEKMFFFFTGMAFYFSLHVNLILYFIKINPAWRNDIKQNPRRILIPGIWWLAFYFLLLPHLPGIGILPVFIYSGIYVILIALAWSLNRVIENKWIYIQLLTGTIFLLLSDTLLGFVLFGQISGGAFWFPNMLSAEATWTIGIFLVFYSLVYVQKELPQNE